MPLRRARAVALALAAALLAAGCAQGASAGPAASDVRFVQGRGNLSLVPLADRRPGPVLEGRLLGSRERLSTAAYAGNVVVLNVWGHWCAPCRAEAPGLERTWRDTRARGVRFLGISTRQESEEAALAFERTFEISYPSLVDEGALLLAFTGTLPPTAIPSTIVLDRQGRIAARFIGPTRRATLRRVVDDVVAEPTP